MAGIVVHSQLNKVLDHVRVEIDTTEGGLSAWTRDFPVKKLQELQDVLMKWSSADKAQAVYDFMTKSRNFGEAHLELETSFQDFSSFDFEKLPPA